MKNRSGTVSYTHLDVYKRQEKGTSLYLHKICVDPAYSGNGYADAMIQYFIEKGHREGYPDVRLEMCIRDRTLIVTCTPSVRKNMKLGLDLQGGFEILYDCLLYTSQCD